MTSPVGPDAQDRYRCPARSAKVSATGRARYAGAHCKHWRRFRAWVNGAETALPPSPHPWFVSASAGAFA